jgi:hypothetical protein
MFSFFGLAVCKFLSSVREERNFQLSILLLKNRFGCLVLVPKKTLDNTLSKYHRQKASIATPFLYQESP